MADITMPQLGETVTEGTITKWLKNVGDRIEEDEVIYEVSTDKVDSEVPSPVAGFLTEIRVPEGETAEVGAVLAVVGDSPPGGGGGGGGAEAAAPEAPVATDDAGGDPEPTAGSDVPSAEPAPEPTGAASDEAGAGGSSGSGAVAADGDAAGAAAAPAEAPQPTSAPATPAAPSGGAGIERGRVLSPVVRRLISEHDLDVDQITGTGAGGRITRADVLAVIDDGAAAAARAPAATPASTPAAAPAAAAPAAAKPAPQAAPVKPGERDEV